MAHALAANLGAGDLDAAALADDALVADALVLAAVALPVLGGTEDALAEEPVLLGLQRAVVDRLGLGDLARAPAADLLRGREADLDRVEIVDVDHFLLCLLGLAAVLVPVAGGLRLCLLVGRRLAVAAVGAHARELDPELLGGAQQVVLLLAHLDALALLGDDVGVERQRLDLLQQDLERLGDRRLGDVLALDDRLVGLDAADGVVGLDGEHLLQGVGGSVGLERPHLHLAEALAAELRLAAQRLLGDQGVGAGRARVDLVVDQVQQLQDVHVADGDLALVGLARAAVVELDLALGAVAGASALVDAEVDAAVVAVLLLPATSASSTSSRLAPSKTEVATLTRPRLRSRCL